MYKWLPRIYCIYEQFTTIEATDKDIFIEKTNIKKIKKFMWKNKLHQSETFNSKKRLWLPTIFFFFYQLLFETHEKFFKHFSQIKIVNQFTYLKYFIWICWFCCKSFNCVQVAKWNNQKHINQTNWTISNFIDEKRYVRKFCCRSFPKENEKLFVELFFFCSWWKEKPIKLMNDLWVQCYWWLLKKCFKFSDIFFQHL